MSTHGFKVGDRVESEGQGPATVLALAEAVRIRPDLDGLGILLDGSAIAIKVDDPSQFVGLWGMAEAARTGVTYVSPPSLTLVQAAPAAAPEPVKSQHPADLKPRGVKAPLGLIPWSVYPHDLTPPGIEEAARACGRYPDGGLYHEPGCFYDPPEPGEPIATFLLSVILGGHLGEVTAEDVAEAFGYGAAKYEPWNWQTFTWDRAAETEYFGAIMRHLRAVEAGEERAQDSGVRHLGHAAAGCLIWAWHWRKGQEAAPAAEVGSYAKGDKVEIRCYPAGVSAGAWYRAIYHGGEPGGHTVTMTQDVGHLYRCGQEVYRAGNDDIRRAT